MFERRRVRRTRERAARSIARSRCVRQTKRLQRSRNSGVGDTRACPWRSFVERSHGHRPAMRLSSHSALIVFGFPLLLGCAAQLGLPPLQTSRTSTSRLSSHAETANQERFLFVIGKIPKSVQVRDRNGKNSYLYLLASARDTPRAAASCIGDFSFVPT